MNKLMHIHAAVLPLRDSRPPAAAGALRSAFGRKAPAPAAARPRGLQCTWVKDAAGGLVCAWSEASPTQDQSIIRRGTSRAGAAVSMAA